jgi:hypothetical protein
LNREGERLPRMPDDAQLGVDEFTLEEFLE